MGLGSQLIAWPQPFVDDLVKRGFRVIRFDNRDCGLSTHVGVPPCSLIPFVPAPYLLKDMADDAESLLSQLLGNAKAHVVGASMGGMIAQFHSEPPEPGQEPMLDHEHHRQPQRRWRG